MFLDDTLEVDVSIIAVEGAILGIVGSEKRSETPMPEGGQSATHVCGTCTILKEELE